MYMREICEGKSLKDTCKMIIKQAIASDSKSNKGVYSALVQLLADLVAEKSMKTRQKLNGLRRENMILLCLLI